MFLPGVDSKGKHVVKVVDGARDARDSQDEQDDHPEYAPTLALRERQVVKSVGGSPQVKAWENQVIKLVQSYRNNRAFRPASKVSGYRNCLVIKIAR